VTPLVIKKTYTQNNGTTNVTGQIFGGDKNINGGTLNITSDNLKL